MNKALSLCCVIALAAAAATFSGCGTQAVTPKATTVFLAPDYASRTIETVAVLPLANVTGAPDADRILGNAIELQLVNRSDYTFMTVQRMTRSAQASGLSADLESLRRQWVHTREFKPELARKLADELKIDAFLVGTIERWQKVDLRPEETGNPHTDVTCRVYLMDARTGDKLWEASAARVVKGPYYDPSEQNITQYMDEAGIMRGSGGKPVQTVEGPAIREVADEVAADIVMAIPKTKAGEEATQQPEQEPDE
jgi:hypothetical protein